MRIFLSFLILLCCVSCSLENNENVAMEDSASISFDTSWGKDVQTRGNEMVYHSINEIGIFAKMKSDGDWQDGESFDDPSSSFMDNVNFSRRWVPEKKTGRNGTIHLIIIGPRTKTKRSISLPMHQEEIVHR